MFNLSTPVEELYLVGPARAKLLKNLGIYTLEDLLLYFPRAHQDLSKFTSINELKLGEPANIKARILEVKSFRTKVRKFSLTQALVEDDTGPILCVWFNQPFLAKTLKPHEEYIFSGKTAVAKNKLQLQNPVYEQVKLEQVHTSRLVPLYSLTASLTQKQLRSVIKFYLDKTILPDYLPESISKLEKLPHLDTAVKTFHFPDTYAALQVARGRLAFDEIFQTQIRVLRHKKERELEPGVKMLAGDFLQEKIENLPYTLTSGQKQALNDILSDFTCKHPGNRLLQGDVGSGKTIIAALAMFVTAKNDYQSALLSPTEVLSSQHYTNLLKLFLADGLNPVLLTSAQTRLNGNPVSRQTALSAIKTGRAKIVIGTHSLIQSSVKFHNLALTVIDEQHRFGVEQRSILKASNNSHLLTMSATPIPRTLALTLYGDLDISILSEMPKGRIPIQTRIVSEGNRQKAYEFISKQINMGRQAFVICPLIEESDKLGVKSATEEYHKLAEEIFPSLKIGLLHGKMKSGDKETVMQAFKNNELQILVSTSVIEVGVDVPNATVMVIEGAERFGLAQLHQFRGRVGRSEHKSYCFLFSSDPLAEQNPRLKALEESTNGFELAEKDLNLRGSGDVYGTKQSGYDFKIASLSNIDLVQKSRVHAERILNEDISLFKYPSLRTKIQKTEVVHLE